MKRLFVILAMAFDGVALADEALMPPQVIPECVTPDLVYELAEHIPWMRDALGNPSFAPPVTGSLGLYHPFASAWDFEVEFKDGCMVSGTIKRRTDK